MIKRTLPTRSSRGQLPPHLREIPDIPKIKKPTLPEDKTQQLRKQRQMAYKMQQLINLKKYPYGKAVHYFFDLDTFPRLSEHSSYVEDKLNCLNNSYSQDVGAIQDTKRGDILNRRYFGLPINLSTSSAIRRDNRCKNVCSIYLYQNEDKKYNCDRILYTLKIILKKIESYPGGKGLQIYEFIKKDNYLQILLDESVSVEEKKEVLIERISILQSRKATNTKAWEFEDSIHYAHSLDQRLHNAVNELKNNITIDNLSKLLFEKEHRQFQLANKLIDAQKAAQFIQEMTKYYYTELNSISISCFLNISNYSQLITQVNSNGCFLVNFPVAVLHFGTKVDYLQKTVNYLIARQSYNLGDVFFYSVKAIIKKLFRQTLQLPEEKPALNYETFLKIFRRRYEDIKRQSNSTKVNGQQNLTGTPFSEIPCFDQYINVNLCKRDCKTGPVNIFSLQNRMELSGKQYVFIFLYFWLMRSIFSIQKYLTQYPDLINFISSHYYPKVCNSLVQATREPLSGMIYHIFEAIADLVSKPDTFEAIEGLKLVYEYDDNKRVGVIWREGKDKVDQQKSPQRLCPFVQSSQTKYPNKQIKR